jgi:transposase
LQPDTAEARLLQRLTEQRRRLVDEKTRQKLRLTACLKLYFPQLLDWFDDVDSPLVGALLQRWPSLQELKRAHPGTLRKFFHEHNCRGEERIQQRIQAIYAATPAVEDAAVLEGEGMSACNWAAVLATLREQIAGLEQRIGQLVAVHPDSGLWASLPGAGAALLPRLLVAFGTRRDRYDSAYQMQCLSGIAPVTQASGKGQWVQPSPLLSQTLQQAGFRRVRLQGAEPFAMPHQQIQQRRRITGVGLGAGGTESLPVARCRSGMHREQDQVRILGQHVH